MNTEVSPKGINDRFVLTSFRGEALTLYDFYVRRGEVENQMIKELKLDPSADRLSSHRFVANQFRLLLHGFAYTPLHRLRGTLHRTESATARIDSLRLKLLKVGARIIISSRRVRGHAGFRLSGSTHVANARHSTATGLRLWLRPPFVVQYRHLSGAMLFIVAKEDHIYSLQNSFPSLAFRTLSPRQGRETASKLRKLFAIVNI
jgi:hypothetical protein